MEIEYQNDLFKDLYRRIMELMNTSQISSKDLCQSLNLARSPLTDWKNQKSKPTLEQFIKLCKLFNVSADYLLFGTSESHSLTENKFLELFNQLDHRGQIDVYHKIYTELDRMAENQQSK